MFSALVSVAAASSGGASSTLYNTVVGSGHTGFGLLESAGQRNVSSVTVVDDTPFDSQPLGFAFPYGGQAHSSVRISPNGALHFDYAPPCGCCFYSQASRWSSPACNMNTSYHNVIAVSLSDFNPQAHADSIIYYRRGAGVFEVLWANVTLFSRKCPNSHRYTFGAALYPSGRVRLVLHTVYDPAQLDNSNECWGSYLRQSWSMGLRGRPGTPSEWQAANTWPSVAPSDGADGAAAAWKDAWFTPTPGAYPPRELVALGNVAVDFCPSAALNGGTALGLCAEPANAPWEGGTAVVLQAAVLRCLDDAALSALTLQCRFAAGGGAHVTTPVTFVGGEATCTAPAATAIPGISGAGSAGAAATVALWYTSAPLGSGTTWFPLVRGAGTGGADATVFDFLPLVDRNPEQTCGAAKQAPLVCDRCGTCASGAAHASAPCLAELAAPCAVSAAAPPYDVSSCCGGDALLGEQTCCRAESLDCFGECDLFCCVRSHILF